MTDTKETEANNRAVGWLRISVGLLFVVFGQYKVFGSAFTLGGGFQSWITQFLGERE